MLNANNVVSLVGRIVNELELRQNSNGTNVCSFVIALDDSKESTSFPPIVAYGNNAEFVTKYFSKGRFISILGHLHTYSVKVKDGKMVTRTEVVADQLNFCNSKSENEMAASSAPNIDISVDEDELPF